MAFAEIEGTPYILQINTFEGATFPESTFEIPECDGTPVDPNFPTIPHSMFA
jgi:hypothetical protein